MKFCGNEQIMKAHYFPIFSAALFFSGLIILGLTNIRSKADDTILIPDSWQVKAPELDVVTTKDVVGLRYLTHSHPAWTVSKNRTKEVGTEQARNALGIKTLSTFKTEGKPQGSTELDVIGRTVPSGRLHADRAKMMVIFSLYLRSKNPEK